MKKQNFLIMMAIMATLFSACKKEEIKKDPNDFISVNLPEHLIYQSLKGNTFQTEVEIVEIIIRLEDQTEISGLCRIEMPASSEEKLLSLEMTRNIFEATNLTPDFWLDLSNTPSLKATKASCIASCQKEFTDKDGNKIKGRGACKAGCWAETAAKIITAAAAVIVVVS